MTWNWASIYWLVWIAGGFCPLEFYALGAGHPEWTLSYQVWHLEGTGATFARFFVGAFLLWLLLHMVLETFR